MDAGEQIKDSRFSETIMRADGLIIVAPEYNHGYPGMLKHALDSNLKEYIHKPVGLCGVSAGDPVQAPVPGIGLAWSRFSGT